MKNKSIRQNLILVIQINLFYFFYESFYAHKINSVTLFADSIDFLEDIFINLLIYLSIKSKKSKTFILPFVLSFFMLIPAILSLQTIWQQLLFKQAPDAFALTYVSIGALIANFICALILSNYREKDSNLIFVAFLSAKNDVIANTSMIVAGLITIFHPSIWPDIIVGIIICIINVSSVMKIIKFSKRQ